MFAWYTPATLYQIEWEFKEGNIPMTTPTSEYCDLEKMKKKKTKKDEEESEQEDLEDNFWQVKFKIKL